MEAATFTGVLAPAGTPKDIITRMHAALEKVLQDKGVIQRFDGIGAEARASSPETFGRYLKKEYDKWAPVIIKAKINAD